MMNSKNRTREYWNCKCEDENIRPDTFYRCPKCGAKQENCENSLVEEVLEAGMPLEIYHFCDDGHQAICKADGESFIHFHYADWAMEKGMDKGGICPDCRKLLRPKEYVEEPVILKPEQELPI